MKKKGFLILIEIVLWAAFVLTMAWLWERWLIPGPHGTIHWVGMDFVPYWVGVRAMLAGQSPYSAATTRLIQGVLLGGPPEAGGDPMLFVYPAWVFLVIAPWALLPLKWAVALWTGSLLFGILHLTGSLALRWGGGRTGRTSLWAVILVLGSLPFLSIAVTKGQLSLLSLGALFLAIRLMDGQAWQHGTTFTKSKNGGSPTPMSGGRLPDPAPKRRVESENGGRSFTPPPNFATSSLGTEHGGTKPAMIIWRDALAGIILAFSILKPTLTVPAMAGILLWAIFERRGYIIAGFAGCIGVLSLASWLAVGNWIPDYLHLLSNTGGAPVLWSLALLRWPWNAWYAMLFIGIGIYALFLFIRRRDRVRWFSAAILVGLALFPMRWIYDLLLGILVPAEAKQLGRLPAACVGIALLAPWGLALFPETLRWPAMVIGLPLAWALVWLALCPFSTRRLRAFFAL